MQIEIDEIQDVVDALEGVATKRIKAEARLEQEMEILEGLGFKSVEEAKKAMAKLKKKITKREADLKEEFSDFMNDYSEMFE